MISESSKHVDAAGESRLGAPAIAVEPPSNLQVRGHGLLTFLILGYVGCAVVVARGLGVPDRVNFATLSVIFPAIVVIFFLAALLWIRKRRGAGTGNAYKAGASGGRWRQLLPSPDHLAIAIPTALAMILLVQAFGAFKTMIPLIQPYDRWDTDFAAWDRIVHGGVDPWRLLQPLVGFPLVTWILNAVYYFLWFPILLAMLFWQCFDLRRPDQRLQFLLTFTLSWVLLGSIAATVFSSAGPCYYGQVTGLDDPYSELNDYLKRASESYPLLALTVQDKLWEFYSNRMFVQGAAISAMPSLHVAMALLNAMAGWRLNKRLGTALGAFAVLIFVGSVHLGWHYAIDGYFSVVVVWAIWKSVGRFLARGTSHGLRTSS